MIMFTYILMLFTLGLSLRGNDQIPQSVLRNSLTDIPTQTFTSLDLSNMSIPNLRGYFKSERFNNLVDLNLSQNVIKVIEAGMGQIWGQLFLT